MNLLPRCHEEFGSKKFWEKFFKKRGEKAFEWYGEYQELCGILHKFLKPSDKILVVGCGNSDLSANLYDVGCKNITNIDVSDTVIKQMTTKNEDRKNMQFLKMDATKMEFEDASFSVVLDKGTLDAILPSDSPDNLAVAEAMFAEITRVLKPYGRYLCISLAQEHILDKVLDYFPNRGWVTKVFLVPEKEADDRKEFMLPVFVYVFVKFPPELNIEKKFEFYSFDTMAEKLAAVSELKQSIKDCQHYGVVRNQIKKSTFHLEEHISLKLYCNLKPTPRYILFIVDLNIVSPRNIAAIFIVPKGRENEWMFGTKSGRESLAQSAGYQRLVVVHLQPDHEFSTIEKVKDEINEKVKELLPDNLKAERITDVPYLSLGNDLDACKAIYKGWSELSGEFVVQEVTDEYSQTFRRLIFLSNRHMVQTESRLIRDSHKSKSGRRTKEKVLDDAQLPSSYQHTMVAGLALLDYEFLEKKCELLIVGLGGGSLPRFLHKFFPQLQIEVVELDPAMIDVATEYFDLVEDNTLKTICADGIDYLHQLQKLGKQKMVIIIDVDNKDQSLGLTGPPLPFLEPEFLQCMMDVLHPKGILILNLVCRDRELHQDLLSKLAAFVPFVYHCDMHNDLNTVIFIRHIESYISEEEAAVEQPSTHEDAPRAGKGNKGKAKPNKSSKYVDTNPYGKGIFLLKYYLSRCGEFIVRSA